MDIVVYVFSAIFTLLAAALMFTWWRNRHPGAFLLAMTYLIAAALSLMLREWWPLAIGFFSAWALRLMGLDPGMTQDAAKQREG
jgi:hypothetical protein